jgi:hypothetical protein
MQELMDPLEFQHRQTQNESLPLALRASIATAITPYFHPKFGILAAPRFIETPIEVPTFESIDQAEDFLLTLSQRVAAGELPIDSTNDVAAHVRGWIQSKRQGLELEIKQLNSSATGDGVLRIEGGLPPLPGTNVIMPDLTKGPMSELTPPGPLTAEVPVVPTTTLQRAEAALLAWTHTNRKGPVEIDPRTWDELPTIPKDQLQALFDKYGVEPPKLDPLPEAAE